MQSIQFVRYLCAQVFEEIRFALLRLPLFFFPRRERLLLGELRKRGYVVLKNFYEPAAIESINREIERTIKPLLGTQYQGISTIPGSARFRRPEKESALLKSLSRDIYWIGLNALYNGSLRYPVLMLSFTEKLVPDGGTSMPGDGVKFFADHPHFDSYKHEVKVVVALTNVEDSSGPTEIAIGSSGFHFAFWREYFSSWLNNQGLLKDKTMTISEDFYASVGVREKILLAPGDVAIFDSRNIHRATPLTEGRRDLLWFYF